MGSPGEAFVAFVAFVAVPDPRGHRSAEDRGLEARRGRRLGFDRVLVQREPIPDRPFTDAPRDRAESCAAESRRRPREASAAGRQVEVSARGARWWARS